jgi:hypothetical protein
MTSALDSFTHDTIPAPSDYLSELSEDERAVYLAAFGAFAGMLEVGGHERIYGAAARGRRAVRWFRELNGQGKL